MKVTAKSGFLRSYLGDQLPIMERMFFFTCFVGAGCAMIGLLSAILINGKPWPIAISAVCLAGVVLLTVIAMWSRKIKLLSLLLLLFLNLLVFPLLFLFTGGMDRGIILYFVLGLFSCALIQRGKTRLFLLTGFLLWYVTIIWLSQFPLFAHPIGEATTHAVSHIFGLCSVGVYISYVLAQLIKEYSVVCAKMEKTNQCLATRAVTDELTGLYNRRCLFEQLNLLLCSRQPASPLSVAMFDVDNFKSVNDTLGHAAGDEALSSFADILIRFGGLGITPYRYGGEEFVLLMEGKDREQAAALAEGIRRETEKMSQGTECPYPLTVSVGICEYCPGMDADLLITGADQKMYAAKLQGKNRVIC